MARRIGWGAAWLAWLAVTAWIAAGIPENPRLIGPLILAGMGLIHMGCSARNPSWPN